MKALKELKARFRKLSTANKVQLIAASALTSLLVVGFPAAAWFAQSGKLEAFTKIKEPANLDIRAGHFDNIQYFDLSNIDIENMIETGTPHRVVFSVSAGDYKIPYKLQLAHTTNIPFKYHIYRAKEYAADDEDCPAVPDVKYISVPLKEQGATASEYTFYYQKKIKTENGQEVLDEVTLEIKNPAAASQATYGRVVAAGSGSYYNASYDDGDDPELYAVPVYEQSGRITYDANSDHDYFILEICYDDTAVTTGNFSEWNKAENKKETDMIYLTASRTE